MNEDTPFNRPAGSGSSYNENPVPNNTPEEEKPTAACNHCGYSVPWDAMGEALMEAHFREFHLDKI